MIRKTIFDEKLKWIKIRCLLPHVLYQKWIKIPSVLSVCVSPLHIFKSSSDYKKQTDQLQAEIESLRLDRDRKASKIQAKSKEISELRFENEKLRSLLTKSECQVTKVYF